MNRRGGQVSEIQQLLSMLEKSPEEQREQILYLIEKDDPARAALLKAKLLNIEQVFMLDEESLSRVLEDVSEENLAHSLRGIDIELRKRTLDMVLLNKKKQVLEIIKNSNPAENEIQSARRQVISRVRELESRGAIHLGAVRRVSLPNKKIA